MNTTSNADPGHCLVSGAAGYTGSHLVKFVVYHLDED